MDEKLAETLIDIGVEINTHQDGDAFVKTYTFNDAQLLALREEANQAGIRRAKDNLKEQICLIAHVQDDKEAERTLRAKIGPFGSASGLNEDLYVVRMLRAILTALDAELHEGAN